MLHMWKHATFLSSVATVQRHRNFAEESVTKQENPRHSWKNAEHVEGLTALDMIHSTNNILDIIDIHVDEKAFNWRLRKRINY